MNMHSRIVLLTAIAMFALPLREARAQIEAGRVIDDSTHAPLVKLHVSLETMSGNKWERIDSVRTDHNGLFQFVLPRPGVYRVGFVGRMAPLFYGAVDTLAADSMQQHEFALPIVRTRDSRAYFEFQVDEPASLADGQPSPRYPAELRARGIDGAVSLQFIVGLNGRSDTTSIKVLAQTHPAFTEEIRRVLPRMKFYPAEIGGIQVRQMVQQQFFFSVNHPY